VAKYRVSAPVTGYTGVSVGTTFTAGVATIEVPDGVYRQHPSTRTLAYFRAQGYDVERLDAAAPAGVSDDQASVPPRKSASTEAWRAYAVEQGMSAEEADTYTRDQLAERYLITKEGDQ
jgi:hypothetical protein